MPESKKPAETAASAVASKASTTPAVPPPDDTPKSPRVPADQPAETVAVPKASEVKSSNNTVGTKANEELVKNVEARVEATAASVEALNASNKAVNEAQPFVKPTVETVKPKTPDQAIAERVEATAASVAAFNASVEAEKKSTSEIAEGRKIEPEVSRVAPLTGELRADSENDSYVTPGKVLQPPEPKPGQPAPEIETAPLVISPLTGEVKSADEISYPTPGMGRDTSLSHKALEAHGKTFELESNKTKFGVAPGQQVSLLSANEEMWKNDDAARNDDVQLGAMLADNLRRNKRFQKNLR